MSNAIFRSSTIRVENARTFAQKFYPAGGSLALDNHLYAMIARENNPVGSDPITGIAFPAGTGLWSDDGVPPIPADSGYQDRLLWAMAIGAKRIDPNDIALVVPRKPTTQWASGNTYVPYIDSDANLFVNNDFYTMNQYFEVFVLVKKGAGVTISLTEPVFYNVYNNPVTRPNIKVDGDVGFVYFNDATQSIVETPEGYTWKYLYTLTSESVTDLLQDNWLPVNFGNTRWGTPADTRFINSQDSINTAGTNIGYAYKILGARYVIVRVALDAGLSGSGLLPAGLNYRQIALVENPKVFGTSDRATFNIGIQANTVIPLGGSNKFALNSGNVIYIENKSPIYRTVDQSEEFKVVLSF